MTEFWKWSFPEFSWLFLSSLVCFTDVKQPMPLHATKSMPGRNSQRQLAMKQLYAGCWVVSRYIGVIHQLAAFPWFWVMLNWMQSLVRNVLKKPTLAICQVAEMVDPWPWNLPLVVRQRDSLQKATFWTGAVQERWCVGFTSRQHDGWRRAMVMSSFGGVLGM